MSQEQDNVESIDEVPPSKGEWQPAAEAPDPSADPAPALAETVMYEEVEDPTTAPSEETQQVPSRDGAEGSAPSPLPTGEGGDEMEMPKSTEALTPGNHTEGNDEDAHEQSGNPHLEPMSPIAIGQLESPQGSLLGEETLSIPGDDDESGSEPPRARTASISSNTSQPFADVAPPTSERPPSPPLRELLLDIDRETKRQRYLVAETKKLEKDWQSMQMMRQTVLQREHARNLALLIYEVCDQQRFSVQY